MSWFSLLDLAALSPLIALSIGAFAVLLADAFMKGTRGSYALPYVSLGTIVTAALAAATFWGGDRARATAGPPDGAALTVGPFALYVALLVLAAAAIAVLYSVDYARRMGFEVGEYFGLLLFSTAGMLYLIAANDLVSLFIGFELMSLSVYALVGVSRADARGAEGAMKYLVLGAFSSGFLLLGLAFLYGATGTVYLDQIAAGMGGQAPGPLMLAAIALLVVGFAFKVGAVPFHGWVPDAYQGAPASVTGFMAVAVKAAAFAVFLRILYSCGLISTARVYAHQDALDLGRWVLWSLAVATMVLGNVAALAQSKIQRLFAYSGIAHSGYVLVGLAAATSDSPKVAADAVAASLFYLVGYGAMTIGAFAVLTTVRRDGRPIEEVDDLAGLAAERPAIALAMTLFMASLIGVPPLVGFMGKLWVFKAAVDARMTDLVVIAVFTTAISVYYYLRVVVVMYMGETAPATAAASPAPETASGGAFATAAAAAATLLLGLDPAGVIGKAGGAAAALLGK